MQALSLTINPTVLETFPAIEIYILRCRGLPNSTIDDRAILTRGTASAREKFASFGTPSDHPAIAEWRAAYSSMGVKPSKHRSSIEALVRRALKGDDIAIEVPLVNIYNGISLEWLSPLGAYDVQKLPDSKLILRPAMPTEDRFHPIGGSADSFPLSDRLLVYAAGSEVMCWGFNCRDSQTAALSRETVDSVFFAEAVTEAQRSSAKAALKNLEQVLTDGQSVCTGVLQVNGNTPGVEIP